MKLIYFILSIALFFSATGYAGGQSCESLFVTEAAHSQNQPQEQRRSEQPKITENKYEALAEELGLTYLKTPVPNGYTREIINSRTYIKKDGSVGKTLRFYRYRRPDGTVIRPRAEAAEYQDVVARFQSFKIDPTLKNVWMSADEDTHIQILSKNSRNETIAIYHFDWTAGASQAKFKRIQKLGPYISEMRLRLESQLVDLNLKVTSKDKVEAAALLLLMSGRIRVGDIKYLAENGTTGVTTLQKNQVVIRGDQLFLKYIGKSGNKNPENPTYTTIEIFQPSLKAELAALKKANKTDPRLLIYNSSAQPAVQSSLNPTYLNRRLRELVAEADLKNAVKNKSVFSVKDLRTWSATVKTVEELIRAGRPPTDLTKKDFILKTVAKNVSRLLNNTPAVARQDYIDPRILNPESYEKLWAMCEERFPNLITEFENKETTDDINFNPDFENLTLEFLRQF